MSPSKHKSLWFLLMALLFMAACKAELYSNMSENEANEMMAILLKNGIECDKLPGKEMTYTLRIDKADMAQAVELLQGLGFPKDNYASMGDVFKKAGLVSSPLEERIRFIYALSQEISETLSQIDSVLSARVHIVLPENNPLSETIQPSSAAVFIRYRQDSNIESLVPQIKKLVVNSIEGLSYDKVSVILFPSENAVSKASQPEFQSVLGIKVASGSVRPFRVLTGVLIILLVLAAGGMGFLFWTSLKHRKGQT